MLRRTILTFALCLPLAVHAQQLAHPGWRGNSITPEVWYRHTTLVRFPAGTPFAQAAAGIDQVISIGADTLILPDLTPPAGAPHPFADTTGTEDDLDTLLRETSARHMHVLLQAPLARLAAHADEVRFWMNRGIAGFDVGQVTAADLGTLQTLRTALDRFPGQRILLAHTQGDLALDRKTGSRATPLAYAIVSAAAPASSAPQFVELAAVAETTGSKDPQAALLRSFLPLLLAPGQPIFDSRIITTKAGRDALQQMLQFRSSHAQLRTGKAIALQTGDLRAWLVKGNGTHEQRSLVLLENPGMAPATLHLQQPLHAANARGTFLRALLRTDNGMGAIDLEGSTLPPGAIAIAELQ